MRGAHPLVLACLVVLACLGRTAAEDKDLAHAEEILREAGVNTDGPSLLAFFRRHTITASDEAQVRRLIHAMGDENFRAREHASAQLASLGTRAVPLLRVALTNQDLEVARRAERCLESIEDGASEPLLTSAARLVAARKPEGADRVLLDYVQSAQKDYLIEAALDALAAVAIKEGKPTPALLNALIHRNPQRRAAAGVALVRTGDAETRPAIRRLLNDNNPVVRMRVGLALATAGDREAVRPLIELLGELPASETGLVEDLLYRLAGEKAPQAASGTGADLRKKVCAAWEKWYEASADRLEMAKLEGEKPRGHTLVVLLDANRLVDLNAAKKVCWQIEGLKFPLDAQILPGKRVLIAEYGGDLVTERDYKGRVVWQKQIGAPLCAQRLPNGNTFIATPVMLLEINRDGKEVWTFTPAAKNGARIMKAARLPNGNVAMIAQDGAQALTRFSEIGRDGKEVRGFGVEQRTLGGRVEVLQGVTS